jgi:hypothetical protein
MDSIEKEIIIRLKKAIKKVYPHITDDALNDIKLSKSKYCDLTWNVIQFTKKHNL